MLISTNYEFRLHIPSSAVDDVLLLQGILDNSEHDFLKDKLGQTLYERLCYFYAKADKTDFCTRVAEGLYTENPWETLLLHAQRMVANDAMARYAYQQILSVNGAGVNMAGSSDYTPADGKILDKGVAGFRKEAMVSLNNLLLLLENWSVAAGNFAYLEQLSEQMREGITSIVELWKESKYYFLHGDLLIPSCSVLQQYIDLYDNRDRFIRLIPDLRFIQDEYIEDAFGADFVARMLTATDRDRMLRKVRRLMVAHLEERTRVLDIDAARRRVAHDEAVSLKASLLALLQKEQQAEQPELPVTPTAPESSSDGFCNGQPGSRIFVPPLLY